MPQRISIEKVALISAVIIAGQMIITSAINARWKQFKSPDGTFSILMPGKPKMEDESTPEINGVRLQMHTYSVSSRSGAMFTVGYADAPMLVKQDAAERLLDAQRQSLTEGDDTRLLSVENLTINGYPARQFKAIVKEGFQADERVCLARRRLYILLVVHDKGEDKDDVSKFFDSFTFKPTE